MQRYTNSVIQFSSGGNFESEINRLFRQIRNQANSSLAGYSIPPARNDVQDYKFSNILVDGGRGRITAGFKSLELLTLIRNGTTPENLFLFDSTIFVGSANDFSTSDSETLTNLVIGNLGLTQIISGLPEDTTAYMRDICLNVAKHVKTGTYQTSMFSKTIYRESRKLVKLYIENNK